MAAKDKEAMVKVLKYMTDQNRPYSAGDIVSNMHNEFNKACIQRTLDQLVVLGKVKEKAYGKQKVFVIDQSIFPVMDEAKISEMDKEIERLQDSNKSLESDCVAMETKLSTLKNLMTLEEANEQLKLIDEECKTLKDKLDQVKSDSENISKDEINKIQTEHKHINLEWRKRKRMVMDVVNAVLEGYPKSKKDLVEEVGLELDY